MAAVGYVLLFRAVGPLELADIFSFGGFRPIPSSMQGKWFAEFLDHAEEWGQKLYQRGEPFHVVQLEVPQDAADQMLRIPNLDQVGPARYAEGDLLELLNQTNLGITEIPPPHKGVP